MKRLILALVSLGFLTANFPVYATEKGYSIQVFDGEKQICSGVAALSGTTYKFRQYTMINHTVSVMTDTDKTHTFAKIEAEKEKTPVGCLITITPKKKGSYRLDVAFSHLVKMHHVLPPIPKGN